MKSITYHNLSIYLCPYAQPIQRFQLEYQDIAFLLHSSVGASGYKIQHQESLYSSKWKTSKQVSFAGRGEEYEVGQAEERVGVGFRRKFI